jgi:hypothetical protein
VLNIWEDQRGKEWKRTATVAVTIRTKAARMVENCMIL